jgi:hypothetical protein
VTWLDVPIALGGSAATKRARVGDYLTAEAAESAAEQALAWIKALRLLRVDGLAFRDRFTYRDDSLWWFAELFMHKEDQVARWFAAKAALIHAIDLESPRRLSAGPGAGWLSHVGAEVAARRHVTWAGPSPSAGAARARGRLRSRFLFWSAYWSHRRPPGLPPASPGGRRPPGGVVAFVHSAFWRRSRAGDGEEGYIGPILQHLEAARPGCLQLVGVGPRTNFRARRWWQAATEPAGERLPFVQVERLVPRTRLRPSLDVWNQRAANFAAMRSSADLRAHAHVDGVDLWPLVVPELEGIASLQFPWSARTMDEAGAALDALEPAAVVTYAEAGGWGRALMLEARRRAIPSVGLQHGFIYRHWLNYRHAPDEMQPSPARRVDRGFPRPDLTLLFDEYARAHLESAGAFPAGSLRVTGSPRLDQTAQQIQALDAHARARVRASVGAGRGDRVVLVATKHAQMRRAFPDLVAATRALPHVRLVVKCHPAETSDPYRRDAGPATHVTITPADTNLAALLAVADAIVTVNSTVAIDAMAFGVPAVVVDLPNNLSPFVDRGVMAGARTGAELTAALRLVLEDQEARAGLLARQREFLREFVPERDGAAAARAARTILDLADGPVRGSA